MASDTRRPRITQAAPTNLMGSSAKSINKAIDILVCLGQVPDGMNLPDISMMVGQARSTTHRLLTALEGRRFVRYEVDTRLWKVGVEAFVAGSAFLRNRDVVNTARPVLNSLAIVSGETASLYAEDEGEIVCLTQVESKQLMRVIARPGGRAMMHASGAGKAILAFLPYERIAQIIDQHGLRAATERTINTPQLLRQNLERVRALGFAVDNEENSLGIRCVAAPVFDHFGEVFAAISISGPSTRINDNRISVLSEQVVAAAKSLTTCSGGIPKI